MTETAGRGPGAAGGVAARVEPLGKSVGRGAAALTVSSLVMRVLSFLCQIVLGAILFQEDFGLFAIASSVSAFVVVLQDGGLRTLIVQRGEGKYDQLEGPTFWLGSVFNLAAALLLGAMAPLIARIYSEPKLTPMLWVIASAILLSSFGAVPLARLRMHMRFGVLSAIEVMGGIVRYGGMILGAVAGLGPIAFVAPLPAVAVLEGIAGYLVTRRTPWMRSPGVDRWRPLLGDSIWLIASSVAGSALYLGSHMALGLTAATALVGIYYFGYFVLVQSGYLIISTAERVLLPVLSRLRAERERQRSAVVRTLRAVAVLGFVTCAGLGAVFAPAEHFIWKGKWAAAVPVVRIMAICYPLFTLHIIARCVVTAEGRFRAHALSVALAGVTLMVVAAASGAITTDVTAISWITGVASVAVSLAYLVWGVRDLGLKSWDVLMGILPIALCGVVALLTATLTDGLVDRAMLARGFSAFDASWRTRLLADGLRFVAAGASCTVVLAVALRVLVPDGLRDCFDVLPDRFSRPARRLLGV